MLIGPAPLPCQVLIKASDPEPVEVLGAPYSQYTASGQQSSQEFLMVSVEGRKWDRKSRESSWSQGWTWVGAMGGDAINVFLIASIETQPILFQNLRCKWQLLPILF